MRHFLRRLKSPENGKVVFLFLVDFLTRFLHRANSFRHFSSKGLQSFRWLLPQVQSDGARVFENELTSKWEPNDLYVTIPLSDQNRHKQFAFFRLNERPFPA